MAVKSRIYLRRNICDTFVQQGNFREYLTEAPFGKLHELFSLNNHRGSGKKNNLIVGTKCLPPLIRIAMVTKYRANTQVVSGIAMFCVRFQLLVVPVLYPDRSAIGVKTGTRSQHRWWSQGVRRKCNQGHSFPPNRAQADALRGQRLLRGLGPKMHG